MNLTQRDLKLLKVIDRYGLLTSKQIQGLSFNGVNTRTMLRRLRALRRKRFIVCHHGLRSGKLVWTLGNGGLKKLGANVIVNLNKNSLEHDVLVSSVRIALDKAGVGSRWQSSHYLRSNVSQGVAPQNRSTDQIPDALFSIQTKKGFKIVALEVELVSKSKSRYRKIVDEYVHKNAIDYIWYVVANPRIGTLIQEISEHNADKFLWSEINELIHNPHSVFLRQNGNKYRLSDLWQISPAHTAAHTVSERKEIAKIKDSTQTIERTKELSFGVE
jgi:hypothetical protein